MSAHSKIGLIKVPAHSKIGCHTYKYYWQIFRKHILWKLIDIGRFQGVEPSGVQALKNPNPLKDVEALVVLAVAVLV